MSRTNKRYEATRVRTPASNPKKASPRLQPSVVIIRGHAAGMEYPLEKPRNLIGRDAAAEVPLRDPLVSRRHAAVLREGGVFLLGDLMSRNGTLFKEARIEQTELRHGDTFTIGDTTVQFILEERGAGDTYEINEW